MYLRLCEIISKKRVLERKRIQGIKTAGLKDKMI